MQLRDFFFDLADAVKAMLRPGEIFTAWLQAEESDFIRFNRTRARQAGAVHQVELRLDLIEGRRHAAMQCSLSGGLDEDLPVVRDLLERLRGQRALTDDDPYLEFATGVHSSEEIRGGSLPAREEVMRSVAEAAAGLDLVGLWSAGPVYRGFANSFGQRNWYAASSFNFDWSCHLGGDQAVKAQYAGFEWDAAALAARMDEVRSQIELLKRPMHTVERGAYRSYLAPEALMELCSLLGWEAFGLKAHRTLQTPLLRMSQQDTRLSASVTLSENTEGGVAPGFTEAGFLKPPRVALIEGGVHCGCLVSPRSAREYGVAVNAGHECPESLDLAAGDLARTDVLARLDRGLYVSNLWYTNFSDRNDARITGLTRYACFWVENGRLVAPVNVMRFDDSLYRMFGEGLIGLTAEREFILDPDTYERRSVASMHLPGALVDGFRLTL